MPAYLIHSLSEFSPLIGDLLVAAEAKAVVEIGVETGRTSELLAQILAAGDGRLISIDPSLGPDVQPVDENRHQIIRQKSLDALPDLEPADAYIIDGDHNYYTVKSELELIDKAAGALFPLVILHDVGWPCGRRDTYYDPGSIPVADRNVPVYRGVTLDNPGTVPGGFNGVGEWAAASQEGGPRNGVLTAVEDFLESHPGLEYRVVPAVFGLGVIFDRRSAQAESLDRHLRPYHENALLARMERNRLELYLRVIELQEEVAELRAHQRRSGD